MSLVRCLRTGGRRALATATFSKTGAPSQVVTLGPDADVKSVGDNEVAIKLLAAPVSPLDLGIIKGSFPAGSLPAVAGTEGVGVVTAVGSGVSGIGVDDWVVPAGPGFGTWRSFAKAKASDVAKVPSDIPVEYAANIQSALTALRLLEDFGSLSPGDFIIQNAADSAVGLAVVQLAKAKGIHTINILPQVRPGYGDTATLIKNLGGDIVARDGFLGTPGFARILSDLPKPKLAILGAPDEGGKIVSVVGSGSAVVTYKGSSSEPVKASGGKDFYVGDWLRSASAAQRSAALGQVAGAFKSGALRLWLERHPLSDITYALGEAADPYKTRRVTLVINEVAEEEAGVANLSAEELGKLEKEFEAAFGKLRA